MSPNYENLTIRLACTRWKPLTAYLKINEVREQYFIRHKNELYATKTDSEIKEWYEAQNITVYRLFKLYTNKKKEGETLYEEE